MWGRGKENGGKVIENLITNTPESFDEINFKSNEAERFVWQIGFKDAGNLNGDLDGFKNNLMLMKNKALSDLTVKHELSEEKKQQLKDQISLKEGKVTGLTNDIDLLKQKIENKQHEIENFKRDGLELVDHFRKWLFIPSMILLTFITIYLIVFYFSAGNTAFFSNLLDIMKSKKSIGDTSNIGILLQSIFNPYAFENLTFTTGLFLSAFPTVFLGFGLLLHYLLELKSTIVKIIIVAILLILNLTYDFIIALKIENQINDLRKYMRLDTSEFGTNFWLVVFGGFVSYIIWGLILHFLILEYEKKNPQKHYQIKLSKMFKYLTEKNNDLSQLMSQVTILKQEIINLQGILTQEPTILINLDKLKSLQRSYVDGFVSWMQNLNLTTEQHFYQANAIIENQN